MSHKGSRNDNLFSQLLSALVKLNDLEDKFIRQQSLLEDLSEQYQEVKNMLELQKKKHADDIDKIKTGHAKDMINMEKKHTEEIEMLRKSLSTKQPITPVVGFHVALSKIWSGSGKVQFDKIISNYGHGWNNITHVFNVPTKGLYFLILTVMNREGSSAYSWLMRGSTRVALAYAAAANPYNVGTATTVLLLDAGEHVYAQHGRGKLNSANPQHYTYLAGFLVKKSD